MDIIPGGSAVTVFAMEMDFVLIAICSTKVAKLFFGWKRKNPRQNRNIREYDLLKFNNLASPLSTLLKEGLEKRQAQSFYNSNSTGV